MSRDRGCVYETGRGRKRIRPSLKRKTGTGYNRIDHPLDFPIRLGQLKLGPKFTENNRVDQRTEQIHSREGFSARVVVRHRPTSLQGWPMANYGMELKWSDSIRPIFWEMVASYDWSTPVLIFIELT